MCKFDLLTITSYTLDKKSLTSRSNYTRGIIDKLNNANFVNIRGVLGGVEGWRQFSSFLVVVSVFLRLLYRVLQTMCSDINQCMYK